MSCFRSGVNIALLLVFFSMFKSKKKNHLKKKELNKKILLLFLFIFHPMNNTLSMGHHALLFFVNLLTLTWFPQSQVQKAWLTLDYRV